MKTQLLLLLCYCHRHCFLSLAAESVCHPCLCSDTYTQPNPSTVCFL